MNELDLEKIALRIASRRVRTAGTIEFKKDLGPVRRNVRVQGFKWSPESLRNLAKILWAAERAQSYGMAALRLFSKTPSAEFSPDGLLGGVGYIQSIKDMRSSLGQAVEVFSSFTDTVHDEVNASHWAPASDAPVVQNIVQDAEKVQSNPEGFVEESFEGAIGNPSPDDLNPAFDDVSGEDSGGDEDDDEDDGSIPRLSTDAESERAKKKKEPRTNLPGDKGEQGEGLSAPEIVMRTTIPESGNFASAVRRMLKAQEARVSARTASDSVPTGNTVSPVVNRIGPAAGNEAGHFNYGEEWPSDDPLGEGFSQMNPILEDGNQDGVTGDDNPTDGDETVLKLAALISSRTANYSWLPGSRNEKNLDYYALGLSAEDVEWLKAHSDPELPKGIGPEKPKRTFDTMWDPDLR